MDYDSYTATKVLLTGASAGAGAAAGIGVFLLVLGIISLVIGVIVVISWWKIFKKAGKNGWEAIIPIYNLITMIEIIEKPMYYIIFFFIPITQLIIWMALVEKFGKPTSFGVLMFFFPFVCLPMLAFGKDTYRKTAEPTKAEATVVEKPATAAAAPAAPVTAESTATPETPVVEPVASATPVEPATAPTEPAPVAAPAEPVAPEPASVQAAPALEASVTTPEPAPVEPAPAVPETPAAVHTTPEVPATPVTPTNPPVAQ